MSQAMELQSATLDNGVRLICCHKPHSKAVSVGLWLHNGSRFEAQNQRGFAHLCEHLLFQDNELYTSREIAQLSDRLGGRINAHTERQLMALTATVPCGELEPLADLLQAMLTSGTFSPEACDHERTVVLRELAGLQEDPELALGSALYARVWPNHPMGQEIIGDTRALAVSNPGSLKQYWQDTLAGPRVAVSAVGAVELERLGEAFSNLADLPDAPIREIQPPTYTQAHFHSMTRSGQAFLMWAWPTFSVLEPEFYTALLANQILGGGLCSRLHTRLRSELGLVYSVQSGLDCYPDCGLLLAQTTCDSDAAPYCSKLIGQIIANLADCGPTIGELETARSHLISNILMDGEDAEALAERLAREHFYLAHHPSDGERAQRLSSVAVEDVRAFLEAISGQTSSASTLSTC